MEPFSGEQSGILPGTHRALSHRLAVGQAEGRAPSLAGAVFREGRVVWSDARGLPPTGPDVPYRIGSISKTLVAALVVRLAEEGTLDLGDPLETHLPGTGVGHVTVAQLLSHTAGLAAETPGPWWERSPGTERPALADLLGEDPLRHPPGRRFHYSNPGYALLGALVTRLRGKPWERALAEEILEPLGMATTTPLPSPPHARGWAVHPWADVLLSEPETDTGLMGPAGQLWSTAEDLCRWGAVLSDGDPRVLSAEAVERMREPASGALPAEDSAVFGLGVQILRAGGRTLIGHGGSMPGFLAGLWVDPEERTGAVVLANATSGPAVRDVAADLIGLLARHEPRVPEPWAPLGEFDETLLELTGLWYWGTQPHTVRLLAGGALALAPLTGGGRASRLRPAGADAWLGLDGYHAGETLRVVRDADGRAGHLDLGSFVFTRAPYDPADPLPGGVDGRGWHTP
ncbi:class A beta-lactamase-related serine hydrolase [Streptomyces sp. AJS327]|uniref:serine hydrolase domain-containing protein n=1 Tax=Streptomyces sp. AJS327 TaxID=2545265 RepID=UPI0015E04FB2|nr:serine hydrolase domain-containing protein [Streptomyces sp. AJS327]MBA0050984.1 class A beta-lactamase-related serine hydrolase [Streptomyces sp. AJS327]